MVFVKKSFVAPPYYSHAGKQPEWRVTHNSQTIYLGAWDGIAKTPPPAVLTRYLRYIVQWEMEFHSTAAGIPTNEQTDPKISEAILWWLRWLESEPPPEGDRNPDGTMTNHFAKVKLFLRPLNNLFGDLLARDFSAEDLRLWRKAVLAGTWRNEKQLKELGTRKREWGADYTNEAHSNILNLFGWLESYGHIPPGKLEHLQSVKRVKSNPSSRNRIVSDQDFDTILVHTSQVVGDLLRIQRSTAARPSELCTMRPADIDRSGEIWIYHPRKWKTQHKGKTRSIPLSVACQQVLLPYLDRDPEDFIFSPREAAQYWREHREEDREPKERTTPVYPSELKRRERDRQKRQKAFDKRHFAPAYTKDTLRQAVQYAIEKARRRGFEVADWTPYDVRHTRITEVQRDEGWETAQALAGHESMNQTKVYSHQREERAIRLAKEIPE